MLDSRDQTQRATAWFCLAIALLIALTPAAGVMVCLGHGGHIGLGVTARADTCPCGHGAVGHDSGRWDSEAGAPESAAGQPAGLPAHEHEHPPCTDLALDPPETPRLEKLASDDPTPANASPAILFPPAAVWVCDKGTARKRPASASWPDSARCGPRGHLEHRATVLLLI